MDTSYLSRELTGRSSCSFPESSTLGIPLMMGKFLIFSFCLLLQGRLLLPESPPGLMDQLFDSWVVGL